MNQRDYDAALRLIKQHPVLDQMVSELLLRVDRLEKATGDPAYPNTVKGAIAKAVDADNAQRRASQVAKTADTGLSDHYLGLKISKKRTDRAAELDHIATTGAQITLDALSKRANQP